MAAGSSTSNRDAGPGGRVQIGPRTLIALLLAVVPALAGGAATQEGGPPSFVRDVYPFEVLDTDGTPYAHPFLGGFNLPRPQLADIDGDGDLDLFVQEYSDAVMFFEQVGTVAAPRYRWRTDRFADLGVGEWYLLVDLDEDGDLDLLGEQPFSHVRMYRNDGGLGRARFTSLGELVDGAGEPVFSDRQNIPKVADLDCNGRLDLMVGRVEGTVTRFEARRFDDRGAPIFEHFENNFQDIEIIGQVLGGTPGGQQRPSLHGANTMALEDIDGDGDLDLFWGDFFEPGLLMIVNRGSCSSPALRSEPQPFPLNDPIKTSGYNAPAFGDLDGDGDKDLLVGVLGGAFNPASTSVDNLLHLEQTGPRSFVLRTERYLSQVDVGSESFPALADVDGDGDLDLFLGNKIEQADSQSGALYFFENIGSATSPRLQLRGPLEQFTGHYHWAPAFGDLDGDGDLDILMGTWDDEMQLVINEGSATAAKWVVADPAFLTLSRGRNAVPTLGDADGDGDLDLFVGESSGELNYYRNVGSAREARFELVSDRYEGIDVGRRSAPTLADIDGDGDLDLVIGSENDGVFLYRNVASGGEPRFERDESFAVAAHPYPTPALADLDGDGVLDLVTGGIGGGVELFAGHR